MGKALEEDVNERLREIAVAIREARYAGNQGDLAEGLGISASYASDFVNRKRGAGREMLVGLGRLAPLELLRVLEIDPKVIITLWTDQAVEGELDVMKMPEALRRAARAAIEVLGCTPSEASSAAALAFKQFGEQPDEDALYWLEKLRKRIPERTESGVHPSGSHKTGN
jgi:hypothetical protein